jgi:hypothetical protein
MAYASRLGCIVIECHTDHVEHAAGFWSEALGWPSEIDEDANRAQLMATDGTAQLVIQGVHESPSIHLDIATDDLQSEIRRLTGIGARKIGVSDHTVVMEAPTGHRFHVRLRETTSTDQRKSAASVTASTPSSRVERLA